MKKLTFVEEQNTYALRPVEATQQSQLGKLLAQVSTHATSPTVTLPFQQHPAQTRRPSLTNENCVFLVMDEGSRMRISYSIGLKTIVPNSMSLCFTSTKNELRISGFSLVVVIN